MDLNLFELLDRVRRATLALICFVVAAFLVHRGNTFEGANFAFIVPVMCVGTALCLTILGLAVFVREKTAAE